MEHSFDIDIAVQCGVNSAILFQNILFWIAKNEANEKHFHDGRYWTYNSRKAFTELFPYLTEEQIKYALAKLIDGGMILVGNFNENKMDKTNWYALGENGLQYARHPITKTAEVKSNGVPDYDELARQREQRNGKS